VAEGQQKQCSDDLQAVAPAVAEATAERNLHSASAAAGPRSEVVGVSLQPAAAALRTAAASLQHAAAALLAAAASLQHAAAALLAAAASLRPAAAALRAAAASLRPAAAALRAAALSDEVSAHLCEKQS